MKILVFGKTGQVGKELARSCPDDIDAVFLGREAADLLDPAQCAAVVMRNDIAAVINAAAWTAVDEAEGDEPAATVVNADAPLAMAQACAKKSIPFLHLSTDYVFDGAGDIAFEPDHQPAPLGAYGRSKLAGETGIGESGAHALILRTSWVVSAHGKNFVKTMLRLGGERDSLRVVADQFGGPTPAASIADALYIAARKMIADRAGGIHHFAGTPDTSWAGFARTIMKRAGLACQIEDIATSDYPTPAQRPLNSRLDCSSFASDFGVQRPDWRAGLDAILSDLGARQ
ncbi:MAG: dTDP-4-dehydrorhamnose reductase [Pseudomonadota bacterium]